ncbi:sodium:proton antiporter [Companilactobacillus crustorum]|uniref:Na(+) H(+) antiporter n=3 Tax=Companilactobacillus TaxID=2767879 RepID=A0A837RIE8_9LACO|nr:sodium:proton antiporter [Companilactobacillus crustorum]KRK43336.1 Na(+) H(+) antiporter [Companilactobacillus crustorum JCM 15951]KRO20885.1 Na(+) H(+) antiporter [Companilactobacillus crustorum]WDT65337.1 sodium:proton antiporter [Companilactobacillus crustorum]GEO77133.1 sodium:proton antiporter [Companilactobacillus crustorum]
MGMMVSSFILILAAVISIFLSQVFTKISVSYISMIIGAIIFLIPSIGRNIQSFNSDIFIGIIVAPLLFFEGQATRLNSVGKEIKHIIQMTVVLVVLCLIFSGFGIWAVSPVILPLAFILAAISTPTDATAMESVTNGLKMPKSEGVYLKMESLFNDASGIILLNMAILWYVNGYINYSETIVDFLISAVGGMIFGFSAAWVMVLFRQVLLRTSYSSLNAQLLLYIVTPLILYYAAEAIHVSGIITVVCAGLVHNAEAQRSRFINAPQIHLGFDLVSMITEILNSIVFVILGFMFLQIISKEKLSYNSLNWIMIGITMYLINIVTRYIYGRLRLKFNNRSGWIFSLGGVHGAVTLALAYTLAEYHVKAEDFNLVLFSESILIILSLIVPTIVFRFLLKKDVAESEIEVEVDKIRINMVHKAIDTVEKMYLPDNVKKSVIFDLMSQKQKTRTRDFVKAWLDVVRHPEFTGAEKELEMRAFMNALAQEREYLDMISQSEVKYQSYVFDLYNEVLMAESLVIGPTVLDENDD